MKPPKAIDDLMWLVAESKDPSAVEAFNSRYPEFRVEMVRRLRVVSDLKRAKTAAPDSIPPLHLTPRATSGPSWVRTGSVLAFGCALGLALAFGAWTWTRPSTPVKPRSTSEVARTFSPDLAESESKAVEASPAPKENPPSDLENQPEPQRAAKVLPGQQPLTMRLLDFKFTEAIGALAKAGNLKIDIAPGGDDVNVRFSCKDEPAGQALVRLCQQSGYTALEQEPGSFLILPVVDPNATSGPTPQDVPPPSNLPDIDR